MCLELGLSAGRRLRETHGGVGTRVKGVVAVPAEHGQRSVSGVDRVAAAGAEPLFVGRARGARGGRTAGDVELADARVMKLEGVPVLAAEQVLHERRRRAVGIVFVDLERAVVQRDDLERDVLVENEARAGNGAQRRIVADGADVEENGLNEWKRALGQRGAKHLEVVARGVVVLEQRADARASVIRHADDTGAVGRRRGGRDGPHECVCDHRRIEPGSEETDAAAVEAPRARDRVERHLRRRRATVATAAGPRSRALQ